MSEIKCMLAPDHVMVDLHANCKREALTLLAQKASKLTGISAETILDTLIAREKLGSTGVGGGVAIPHGKFADLEDMVGIVARLAKPVDFDAVDDQPVDLLFMLLAPESANAMHLKSLSKVARLMRSDEVRAAMRGASSDDALFAIVIEQEKPRAA
ncbi:PTS IIA-like nitrogen regulatory protein PtsN [Parvularcula flava]|uniref:PTS IIA-like nitrogen-regulatory protein PtsN n=1 Tax=Aquisalinus luteolus TaxID=1566827 RepID=A0A8J3AAG8_9PROT|nr:PTS IIA-like nitrogen regulatory protein PtsN [Aquisalinus luteolus]NHK29485.1 PTS IIA-like nitrogen regulatory protein PtsN [Aquisalinus luteolus]GGI01799.1 PTS IIA-like nitrogen-regulatory protein PtsN [Aquisalinus luteolus]